MCFVGILCSLFLLMKKIISFLRKKRNYFIDI
nr:MAG TPA: Protein of unknown function (DUF2370) [Inoviridae sp.]